MEKFRLEILKENKISHPNVTDPSTKKNTIFEAPFLKVPPHFFSNLLPRPESNPTPKIRVS